MKAFTLDSFDSQPALRSDLRQPAPDDREVLVSVKASSPNPVDLVIAAGALRRAAAYEFPVTLGRDFAGVVERVGARVASYAPGDQVYGFLRHFNPTVREGTWSELIVVPEDEFLAPKPASVDLATSGAAPLSGVTALTAIDALNLSVGDTVMIIGATGGVGSFAAQLAALTGAEVIAPGYREDEDYLRSLGVAVILDREAELARSTRDHFPDGVDAMLDVISADHDTFDGNAALLKRGGRAASTRWVAGDGPGRTNVEAAPSRHNLERLAWLLDRGKVRVPVHRIYRFEQALDALAALETTHPRGKLAIERDVNPAPEGADLRRDHTIANTAMLTMLIVNVVLGIAVCVMVITPLRWAIRAEHRASAAAEQKPGAVAPAPGASEQRPGAPWQSRQD